MGLSIGLLGDLMLGRGVAETLATHPPEQLWSPELRELASSLDLVVANLECCISRRGNPTDLIPGKPFFFRAPPSAVLALEAMNVRVAGVANNHVLDYGPHALEDTLAALHAAGIAAPGAGFGEREARRPATVATEHGRVGVVAVSDHPYEYAATPGRWGMAFADLQDGVPAWMEDEFGRLREECDAVIAFPHWGPNMTTHPTRAQRAAARRLQELGADLVAGHSAHCFHGVEHGPRGPVLFDLGDALDDYRVDRKLRNDLGVMAIWRPQSGGLELAGLKLDYAFTRLASGTDADWIAARLARACGELGTRVERLAEQRFRVLYA